MTIFKMTSEMTTLWNTSITIGAYNICDARNNWLEMAMRAIADMWYDIIFLMEMKFSNDHHTYHCKGYDILATVTPIHNQGGIALAWRTQASYWHLEGTKTLDPNLIVTVVTSAGYWWCLSSSI